MEIGNKVYDEQRAIIFSPVANKQNENTITIEDFLSQVEERLNGVPSPLPRDDVVDVTLGLANNTFVSFHFFKTNYSFVEGKSMTLIGEIVLFCSSSSLALKGFLS